ncbi:MarR family winged helix-turn-helix transcriptional regulator [Fictibacillus sp. b24]|uniref:MarR family winged helix-turn-helix transcriptional regulator n=1 Tax=Fictibacillus sp. b24 TaxID=3055863 RepID=UPI00338FD5FF
MLQNLSRKYDSLQKSSFRMGEADLTLAHSHILYEINKHDQLSMQQTADLLGVDITTFSRQIQTLIKAGLVKKTPNPNDKRIYLLSLTEKGVQTASHIDTIINSRLTESFSQLSDFERDTILHSLKILTKVM